MKFRVGDLVQIIEDPMSHVVPEELNGTFAIIISIDNVKKIYTVTATETNQKIKLLKFMMKCA